MYYKCSRHLHFGLFLEVLINIIQLSHRQTMSFEDASPATIQTQKSITEQKTTNTIRKITIQTLSPIVAKLEEHISFLLEQTSKLRSQNAKLAIATANQQALERQFDELSQNFQKLSAKLNHLNKDKDNKLKEREAETKKLAEQLENIKKESQTHSKQIDIITQNNESYLARIDQNKQEQLQSIEQLKASIENYYQQEMIKMESIREQFERTKHIVTLFQDKRNADQEQIKQIMKITTLYETERNDIKKIIQKTTYLENNVVMLPDYQQDKKFQRISNEQTKNDIRTMLDQALTPEIRNFLPKLIIKLNDLQRFQETLDQIQKKFKTTKKEQDQRMCEMSQTWQNKFKLHQESNNKDFDDVNKKVNKNLQILQQKIQINEDKFNDRLRTAEQQLKQLQRRWREGVNRSIKQLDTDIKQYLNVWGQKFLDRNKDNIYQLVQTQKPAELHKEENRVQYLVFSMEPLLNSVRQELKAAQNQIQSSKQTLYERLSFFSNQIVKIKSDMTRQTSENKRILDTFSLKLHENRDTCDELSLLLSKIVQTTAISYALSLDQSYLHRQHEVYVTYNDGIVMEVSDNDQINYRRHLYVPQLLKRAVLTELVKIIDNSILNRPLLNWNKNQFKPSHLSPSIQANYKTLYQQSKNSIIVPTQKNTPIKPLILQRKSLDSRLPQKIQYQSHHLNKFSPNNQIFSKTIDPDHNFHSATRYDIGYQEEKEYTGRRKNIKLKKIEKKDN